MTRNIGIADRNVRIVLGLIVLVAGLLAGSWWGLIGLIPLGTGIVRWCPIYAPFGLSTVRRQAA